MALLALVSKDWRLMLRNRAAMVFVLLAPVVVISVAGFSLSSLYGSRGRKGLTFLLPVANRDGGEVAKALVDALSKAEGVELVFVDEEEASRLVAQTSRAGAALVIPEGFSDSFRRGRSAPVRFLTDPVKYIEVLKLRGAVERAYGGLLAARVAGRVAVMEVLTHAGDVDFEQVGEDAVAAAKRLVEQARALDEKSLTSTRKEFNTFDQNVPGFGVTFLMVGTLFGVGLGLTEEREWGMTYRLQASPVPLTYLVAGKVLWRFGVGVVQMSILFFIGRIAFAISLGPSILALALVIVAVSFAAAAFGLVMAALAPSRDAVLPLGTIAVVGMTAMGGCWWPISIEPAWLQAIARVFPAAWAMQGFNDLMLRERGFWEIRHSVAALLLFGALYLVLGAWLYVRRELKSR